MQNSRRRGFTLLEMSIVLIIIGVLVAAVMYAKSLTVTSRLQTVITDVDSFTSAVANFRQQYNALPGDFPAATSIWGQVSSGCTTAQGTGTQTCNGNGDGMVGGVSGQEYESFRFWQQLGNAGMFSQSVTGVPASGGVYASLPGANVPKGPVKGSGYSVKWLGTVGASDANYFAGFYGNAIFFGGGTAAAANLTYAPVLSADQAAAIDSKIDDGLPATGKVRANIYGSANVPNCSTTASASTAVYNNSSNPAPACSLLFIMGF